MWEDSYIISSLFAGLFLTLVMTLNSLSLMFATMVINIKKKGDRKPCQAVPDSILLFCQKVLAKITFTRKLEFRDFYTTCMEEEKLLKKVLRFLIMQ